MLIPYACLKYGNVKSVFYQHCMTLYWSHAGKEFRSKYANHNDKLQTETDKYISYNDIDWLNGENWFSSIQNCPNVQHESINAS